MKHHDATSVMSDWSHIFVKKIHQKTYYQYRHLPIFWGEGRRGAKHQKNIFPTKNSKTTSQNHPKPIHAYAPNVSIFVCFSCFSYKFLSFKLRKAHKRQKMQVLFPCSIPQKNPGNIGKFTAQVSTDLEASESVSEPEALAESREPRLGSRHILKGCHLLGLGA